MLNVMTLTKESSPPVSSHTQQDICMCQLENCQWEDQEQKDGQEWGQMTEYVDGYNVHTILSPPRVCPSKTRERKQK